jgi:hypothetical protein
MDKRHNDHQLSADVPVSINGIAIEVMAAEEIEDAICTINALALALEKRKEQLDNITPALPESYDDADRAEVIDKAKVELQKFYESPMGKAILRALRSAYENPGTTHSITNPEKPLPKDALASLIKKITVEMFRIVALDNEGDLDRAVGVQPTHIKGYGGTSSANAAVKRLISGYYGTVSHLTVGLHNIPDDSTPSDTEQYLFDLSITKKPTGKPAFTETVTMEIALPNSSTNRYEMEYRLIPRGKSQKQELYEDSSKQIGRAIVSQNIASPLSGGLVSPR